MNNKISLHSITEEKFSVVYSRFTTDEEWFRNKEGEYYYSYIRGLRKDFLKRAIETLGYTSDTKAIDVYNINIADLVQLKGVGRCVVEYFKLFQEWFEEKAALEKRSVWLLVEEARFYHYSATSVLDIYDSEEKALGALGTAQMDQIHAIENGDDNFSDGYEVTFLEDGEHSIEFFDKENGSYIRLYILKREVH